MRPCKEGKIDYDEILRTKEVVRVYRDSWYLNLFFLRYFYGYIEGFRGELIFVDTRRIIARS